MKMSDTTKIEMHRKLLESITAFNLKEHVEDWEYNELIDEINFVARYTQDNMERRDRFIKMMLEFVG